MGSLNPENLPKQELDDSGYVQEEAAVKEEPSNIMPLNLLDLSDDVLLYILRYCTPMDLKALGYSCSRLSSLVVDRTLWQRVDARGAPAGARRLRWLLTHALGAHTAALRLSGYARETKICNGGFSYWPDKLPRCVFAVNGAKGGKDAQPRPKPLVTLSGPAMNKLNQLCPKLSELYLDYVVIDCRMTKISMFPTTLRVLSLRGSKCYNVEKPFLYKIHDYLRQLEEIDVSECEWVEPACILPLSKLPRLARLYMQRCLKLMEFVAYASLATRYGFKTLKILDLRGSPVGDSEVSALGWVPLLEELYLSPGSEPVAPALRPPPECEEIAPWEDQEPEIYASKYASQKWIAEETALAAQFQNMSNECITGSCMLLHEMYWGSPQGRQNLVWPENYTPNRPADTGNGGDGAYRAGGSQNEAGGSQNAPREIRLVPEYYTPNRPGDTGNSSDDAYTAGGSQNEAGGSQNPRGEIRVVCPEFCIPNRPGDTGNGGDDAYTAGGSQNEAGGSQNPRGEIRLVCPEFCIPNRPGDTGNGGDGAYTAGGSQNEAGGSQNAPREIRLVPEYYTPNRPGDTGNSSDDAYTAGGSQNEAGGSQNPRGEIRLVCPEFCIPNRPGDTGNGGDDAYTAGGSQNEAGGSQNPRGEIRLVCPEFYTPNRPADTGNGGDGAYRAGGSQNEAGGSQNEASNSKNEAGRSRNGAGSSKNEAGCSRDDAEGSEIKLKLRAEASNSNAAATSSNKEAGSSKSEASTSQITNSSNKPEKMDLDSDSNNEEFKTTSRPERAETSKQPTKCSNQDSKQDKRSPQGSKQPRESLSDFKKRLLSKYNKSNPAPNNTDDDKAKSSDDKDDKNEDTKDKAKSSEDKAKNDDTKAETNKRYAPKNYGPAAKKARMNGDDGNREVPCKKQKVPGNNANPQPPTQGVGNVQNTPNRNRESERRNLCNVRQGFEAAQPSQNPGPPQVVCYPDPVAGRYRWRANEPAMVVEGAPYAGLQQMPANVPAVVLVPPAEGGVPEPRNRVLYVNVGLGRHVNVPAERHNQQQIFLVPPHYARLDYENLVTDIAIRKFGRPSGENVNVVRVGVRGLLPGPFDDPHARPDRSNLRRLSVTGYTTITDVSLNHLATAAPRLERIDFTGTSVTEEGVMRFRNTRPDCEVRYGPADDPKEAGIDDENDD